MMSTTRTDDLRVAWSISPRVQETSTGTRGCIKGYKPRASPSLASRGDAGVASRPSSKRKEAYAPTHRLSAPRPEPTSHSVLIILMDVFPHLQPSRQRSSFRPNFQYYWQRGAHSESGAGGHVRFTREQQGSRDMYELHSRRNTMSPPPHIKSEIQVAGRPPRARRSATGQGAQRTGTCLMPCLTRSGRRAHAGGASARQWRKRLWRRRATQTWGGLWLWGGGGV